MSIFTENPENQRIRMIDIILLACIFFILYGIVHLSAGMIIPFSVEHEPKVNLQISMLPYYGGRSLLRMFIAFIASLIFSIVYGYIAAKNEFARKILIPLLDILQSIPVLGFLSATILMFINFFPNSLLGVEIASIFAIFTSMAWNMTFSVYQSIMTAPKDLQEATELLHLNWWQQFTRLELPVSIIGLIWNSMMSFGGAWFFLAASEAISVLGQDIQLPGVGSYLAAAIDAGNVSAMLYAMLTMLVMIFLVDQLFWRPLVVWSQKFKVEFSESDVQPTSFVYDILHASWLMDLLQHLIFAPIRGFLNYCGNMLADMTAKITGTIHNNRKERSVHIVIKLFIFIFVVSELYNPAKNSAVMVYDMGLHEIFTVFSLGLYTFCRVMAALAIGALWTIPVGVKIGLQPKLSAKLQPIIQMVASFPANMIFPFVTIIFLRYQLNFETGSVFLMILGTQWYILFNVIAGAMSIPNDLLEAASVFKITGWKKWKSFILPSIFPSLVTGLITASGGAWNASIVSELVTWKDVTLTATGLGAYVSQATTAGDWPHIVLGVMTTCIFVVCVNRLVWRRLYRLAESKFHLD
ncbi:MAG: ABC transporter permease subunit [Megasphaera sp.]|uniref:ABC transporter permease n=1 Tax=Megasphaera sueciensis TaxID=349094 RepID=UPI003D07585B|nr:ABC transporter permease subunit [Megasphaera sp.]MCI1823459.1 ABC transporter permease subunit [Megasphaera sp.]